MGPPGQPGTPGQIGPKGKRKPDSHTNGDRNHQIVPNWQKIQNLVCLALKEYWLYVQSNAERLRKQTKKTKHKHGRSLKTFIYSTSYRQKQQLFVWLQVLKEIREVRVIKGKTGSLEWSTFVGEGPHVLVELKLFTKVSIGQCAEL